MQHAVIGQVFLAEELVRRGHDVTLYAAGDSTANVRLAAGSCQSLRLIGLADFGPMFHLPMLSDVYDHAGEFDVIHSHVDCLSFPLTRMVHRANGLDYAWSTRPERLPPIYRSYSDLPVVSISNDQRRPLPEMNWIRTVYHGLPRDLLKLVLEPATIWLSRKDFPGEASRSRH